MFLLRIFAVLVCLSGFAPLASASTLLYQPETIRLTVPAGTQQQVQVRTNVDAPKGSSYMLWFVDQLGNGNLPAAWLSLAPARTFVFRSSPGTATLTVSVPNGAAAGTYTGQAFARATSNHDIPDRGTGIQLEVTVPSLCSGVPQITIDSLTPQIVWPPDRSLTQVVVSGNIVAPEGCTIAEAGYAVEDEYKLLSSMGEVRIETDGAFTLVLPVEAMRYGQDKDGRHYQITLYARDEAGLAASQPQLVVVPHDRHD